MDVKSMYSSLENQTKTDNTFQAARALGELLSQTAEYRAFLEALKAVNNDLTVQKISAQMRACNLALQWGRDVLKNSAELEQLEQEMEALPVMQTYRQAELSVLQLFRQVDEIISASAHIEFATHARRSCCG